MKSKNTKGIRISLSFFFLVMAIIIISIISVNNIVQANASTKITQEDLAQIIEQDTAINLKNLNLKELVNDYNKLTEEYTNEELATMLQEHKNEIQEKSGVSDKTIEAGTEILKSTDTQELKDIINKDIDVDEIQKKIDNGYTPSQIIEETFTPEKTAQLGLKVLMANQKVKTSLTVLTVESVFLIVIRWLIYKKAGQHGWATLVPIYRDVVYLRTCGFTPWILLWLLLPIIGWAIFAIMMIVARFKLAKKFGRGFLFGCGLLIFRVIFEAILAFSSNEYIEE